MNFPMLPPEINSGRMYAGPGSGSMIEAVTAWERLATQLSTAAADYRAATSKLAAGWGSPASTVMTEATTPYIDWLDAAAKNAEYTAAQAKSAVSAHQTALAAIVPPSAIDTNRAQRTSLAKANRLGQCSPAIADIEAEYDQMWAQDTEAMYAYARACADASTVTPFSSPPPLPNPARQDSGEAPAARSRAWTAAPEVISAGSQLMSTIPEVLGALSSSPVAMFATSLSSVTSPLSKLSSLSAPSGVAISHLNSLNRAAALDSAAALRSLIPNVSRPSGAKGAGLGRGISIGTLWVPQAWARATAPRPVTEAPGRRGLERGDVSPN